MQGLPGVAPGRWAVSHQARHTPACIPPSSSVSAPCAAAQQLRSFSRCYGEQEGQRLSRAGVVMRSAVEDNSATLKAHRRWLRRQKVRCVSQTRADGMGTSNEGRRCSKLQPWASHCGLSCLHIDCTTVFVPATSGNATAAGRAVQRLLLHDACIAQRSLAQAMRKTSNQTPSTPSTIMTAYFYRLPRLRRGM